MSGLWRHPIWPGAVLPRESEPAKKKIGGQTGDEPSIAILGIHLPFRPDQEDDWQPDASQTDDHRAWEQGAHEPHMSLEHAPQRSHS